MTETLVKEVQTETDMSGLRLLIDNQKRVDSTTKIGWCLDRPLKERLRGQEELFLLLVVSHPTVGETSRQIVPLAQMTTFVSFERTGANSVHAAIVRTDYKEQFLKGGEHTGTYKYEFLDHDHSFLPNRVTTVVDSKLEAHYSLEVVVPAELFAKKPSARLSRWVNRWYETAPKDQCEFRHRKIWAFAIQWECLALWSIICPVIRLGWWVIGLFLGMRGLQFKPVLHPFHMTFDDVWEENPFAGGRDSSVFLYDSEDNFRKKQVLFFYPPLVVAMLALAYVISSYIQFLDSRVFVIAILYGLIIAVVMVVMMFVSIWSFEKIDEWVFGNHRKRMEQRWLEEFDRLACGERKVPVDISEVPWAQRTVVLRFQQIKSGLCRPYPKG